MPKCNLCGSQTERIFRTKIEGAEMNVCSLCAKLGQVVEEVIIDKPEYEEEQVNSYNHTNEDNKTSAINVLVEDYGARVKKAREQKGLKQEQLAKMLAIKESLLHNIESGHFEPSDPMIIKLEKYLHIKLMTQIEDKPVRMQPTDDTPLTLGDMIKNKLKK
jgi:putative transcription factor